MKTRLSHFLLLVGSTTCIGLITACQSTSIDARAEKLLRTGAARDMTEARQMAADHDWPESARRKEEEAKRAREAAALPKK
jgi:2,4-dienoyl-CoA reductase-like NADH-dependent reductase (Old Yellow Enzyme family)